MRNSNNKPTSNYNGGIGFFGALTLLFIFLKLTGSISWSWWWVLAPLWISFVVFLVIMLVLFIIIVAMENSKKNNW